jgi:lipopolysaccharide export system protein LptA
MSPESDSLSIPATGRKSTLARLRPLILAGVVSAIIMQIVALSPSSIEESHERGAAPVDPDALIPKEKITLAPGIPKEQVPEYSVDQFNYVSTHESVREWNLIAAKANFYNSARVVHARTVKAYLFDPDGKITIVTGQEAKYTMASPKTATASAPHSPSASPKSNEKSSDRDLEVFGDVITTFPDGFEVRSEYMRYRPDQRTVEIPASYRASGRGKDENGQILGFTSQGMYYSRKAEQITLPQDVKVTVEKANSSSNASNIASNKGKGSSNRESDTTLIESDRCVISRKEKLASFTMNSKRSIKERFVRVTQPTLFSKGRWGELNYGDDAGPSSKLLHKVALYEDVLVKETGKSGPLRYATAGQANFDNSQDIVILTKFPQVYENEDTVTGDRIILHRDSDIVEVEHSNSFSTGQSSE